MRRGLNCFSFRPSVLINRSVPSDRSSRSKSSNRSSRSNVRVGINQKPALGRITLERLELLERASTLSAVQVKHDHFKFGHFFHCIFGPLFPETRIFKPAI